MTPTPSFARRLANRLAAHAARVLPGERSAWARAMTREVEHLPADTEALRWAAGAVFASYRQRGMLLRSFALSVALVVPGLLLIEGAHLFSGANFTSSAMQQLSALLPAPWLTTPEGITVFAVLLTVLLYSPIAIIAWIVGRGLIRWAPTRARMLIKATIVLDAAFLAGGIVVNMILLSADANLGIAPGVQINATTVAIWMLRVLFVAGPLLILLRTQRGRLDAAAQSLVQ